MPNVFSGLAKMFIRTKRLKGRHYGYLVRNTWKKGKVRQKTHKYLGRVYSFERKHEKGLTQAQKVRVLEEYISKSSFKNIILDLVKLEFLNHSLEGEGIKFEEEALKITKNERKIVLGINNGFLCQESLKNLLNYRAEKDYEGFELAKLLVSAGLKVEKDVFVELFEKLRPKQDYDKDDKGKPPEIYY